MTGKHEGSPLAGPAEKKARTDLLESGEVNQPEETAKEEVDQPEETARGEVDEVTRAKSAVDKYSNENNPVPKIILSALLDVLCDDGKQNVATDIITASKNGKLEKLGLYLQEMLIRPLLHKPLLRGIETSSPLPAAETTADHLKDVTFTPNHSQQTPVKNACLSRDSHRCVFTNTLDYNEWVKEGRHHEDKCVTEASHIVPYAFGSWKAAPSSEDNKYHMRNTKANAMRRFAALYRCFPSIDEKSFFVNQLTSTQNMLTTWQPINRAFGGGDIWLKFLAETSEDTAYEVCFGGDIDSLVKKSLPNPPPVLRFKPGEDAPKKELLMVHAAVSQVAQAVRDNGGKI